MYAQRGLKSEGTCYFVNLFFSPIVVHSENNRCDFLAFFLFLFVFVFSKAPVKVPYRSLSSISFPLPLPP